ncbi:DTW domain protein [Pseudoalteromonas sp. P1-9]|uniref:tRNA-uridine aminocarboxypropyltransferase n=1 Tax=Pseudoalteromonas sp. P1-9 TaxID=1710354 RepID=UPI0006D6501E|nr:tRNA-uridine aminocarboxypropyltransferase [Pseudoalteromonas sp. P1-9]KPV96031.1 DTW domain protein [Pseudoalteromonas sp. P1-9]
MARPTCNTCHFVKTDCICAHVKTLSNRINIIVLQHKGEEKNAKNTVRLAELIYSNITVLVGETPEDFDALKALPQNSSALLYPTEDAEPLEDNNTALNLSHLIVLDGTWKKANKLFFSLDILSQFKQVSFSQLPENRYHIRKANRMDSLSSLEAIAYALNLTEKLPMEPAYTALEAMMENQFKHMPAEVRARYKQND